MAHKLAFYFKDEPIPKIVDHTDGDKSNNTWENLRGCTHQQNLRNAKRYSTNTSGHKNVNWDKLSQKWKVRFTILGKKETVGYFDKYEDAVQVAKEERRKRYGEFARDE